MIEYSGTIIQVASPRVGLESVELVMRCEHGQLRAAHWARLDDVRCVELIGQAMRKLCGGAT